MNSQTNTLHRVEELDQPGFPSKFAEIREGALVVSEPAGKYHNRLASRFEDLFMDFCSGDPELDYGGDNDGFLLQRDPDTLVSPDASLYRFQPEKEKTWLEFAPELAVEVISPSNRKAEVDYKLKQYLAHGGEQVWVVDPDTEEIEMYFYDGRHIVATGDQTVVAEGIAEGLEIELPEIFRKR